jgi:hypothetical protein
MVIMLRKPKRGTGTMGVPPPGQGAACPGQDVIDALNDVFGDVTSSGYKTAKTGNLFGAVASRADLIAAYCNTDQSLKDLLDVGNSGWKDYLTNTLSDVEAARIAGARAASLAGNVPMTTEKHPHAGGNPNHVNISYGSGSTPTVIDSPFPIT